MPLDQTAIAEQLARLADHRRTAAHLIAQAAQYGGEVYAPAATANGLALARDEIARAKATLRAHGVAVDDAPGDLAPPAPAPAGPSAAHADAQGVAASDGATISGVTQVHTGGGAYIGQQIVAAAAQAAALHQLRAPVGDFVGREREIAELLAALGAGGRAAAISGLRGLGGVGKTELAYVVADRLRAAYPDAQLVLGLRGASDTPMPAALALQTVIRAFQPEARLPDTVEQLQPIYAATLAGTRALILADDARDAAHVRALLPPPGCALLVTSRAHFQLPGMRAFDLDSLPEADASALLRAICPRVGADAPALAGLCGLLPLALRVAASFLAERPARRVDAYLAQLRDEQRRLEALRDPSDPALDVPASLRLSYDALDAACQSALCQLSVFPASYTPEAARAVLAPPAGADADSLLDTLGRLSLLDYDATTERYRLHDLVRAFAAAQLADADAVRLRHAEYYQQLAWQAGGELYNQGGAQLMAGLALFDRERAQIEAGWDWACAHAGDAAADRLVYAYANAVLPYIGSLRYHPRHQRIPYLEAALSAARNLGNRLGEGVTLGNLGLAYADLGDVPKAIECYEQRLAIARALGDRQGEGTALGNLGIAYADLGDVPKAIEHHEQHLAIARALGDRRGEGNALGNLGIAFADLGDVPKAIECYEQWLAIARALGDRRGEGQALGNLGIAYYTLGDVPKAIEHHEQHLAIARALGDRQGEGNALGNLGVAYKNLGDVPKAIEHYEQWLVIAREIGDRRGEGQALGNLGIAYYTLGDVPKAIEHYEQRQIIAREIGDRQGESIASWNLGLAYEQQGDLAHAAELMQVRVDYFRALGHPDAEQRAKRVAQLRRRIDAAAQDAGGDA